MEIVEKVRAAGEMSELGLKRIRYCEAAPNTSSMLESGEEPRAGDSEPSEEDEASDEDADGDGNAGGELAPLVVVAAPLVVAVEVEEVNELVASCGVGDFPLEPAPSAGE